MSEEKEVKVKTVEMGIMDRIVLMQVLPPEGNLITMRVLREFKAQLDFTADEIKAREIRTEGGMMQWNGEGDKKIVEVSAAVRDIIKAAFKKLDDEKKITVQMLPVYDLFLG
jgi:hypothetical protein